MSDSELVRIGLAVSHGTGEELATSFVQAVDTFAACYGKQYQISTSPRIYHSYASLKSAIDLAHGDSLVTSRETLVDAEHYERWCRSEAQKGTAAIFRFSISAQALYDVRQRLKAAKFERFDQPSGSIIIARDQAQGFYAGVSTYDSATQTLNRTCQFQRDVMGALVDYSIHRARKAWGTLDRVSLVYKHHLFDGVLDMWAEEWSKHHGLPITFTQPDTNNRNILAYGLNGNHLMVCANEYADIVEVFFLEMFGGQVQETSCSESVYLEPGLKQISEYQTVHGSADDIAGMGIVNPTATIKAAAAIMENQGGCKGLITKVAQTVDLLEQQRLTTPDRQGCLSTKEFTATFLEAIKPMLRQATAPGIEHHSESTDSASLRPQYKFAGISTEKTNLPRHLQAKSAVIVMDWQNDFIHRVGPGVKSREGPAKLREIGANIHALIGQARSQSVEVIFIRFLGDKKFQLPNWQERNRRLDMTTGCLESSPGADFAAPVKPTGTEKVFDKHACYDAFLSNGFEAHLQRQGIQHLVLVGIYADICIDATSKSAYQKGLNTTILTGCTTTLHLPFELYLEYAQKVYGTQVLDGRNKSNNLFSSSSSVVQSRL